MIESRIFNVTFHEDERINVSFSEGDDSFEVSFGAGIEKEYHGMTEVMPSSETQTLHTANRVLMQDITIDPIPSNYGLITYNGSIITVS